MPILNRIRRIARANITQFLNQVEPPEDEMLAKIHELESAAREAKDALASFAVTYKRLEKNLETLKQSHSDWQHKAETAVKAGDESLARRSLGERIRVEERMRSMEPVLASRRETYDELKENLVGIHDQLNLTRSRMQDLQARKRAAEAEQAMGRQMDALHPMEDDLLDRLEDKVLESEARTEIDRELRGDVRPLEERLARDARSSQVDAELDALKRSLSSGGDA